MATRRVTRSLGKRLNANNELSRSFETASNVTATLPATPLPLSPSGGAGTPPVATPQALTTPPSTPVPEPDDSAEAEAEAEAEVAEPSLAALAVPPAAAAVASPAPAPDPAPALAVPAAPAESGAVVPALAAPAPDAAAAADDDLFGFLGARPSVMCYAHCGLCYPFEVADGDVVCIACAKHIDAVVN